MIHTHFQVKDWDSGMIENEVKYVLQLDADREMCLNNKTHIMQGYDKNGARVRKQDNKFTFNYKWKIGNAIEEFEMKISKEEFEHCYENCIDKLEKVRYSINDKHGNIWDIDFFVEGIYIYFVMAECEMKDPYATEPEEILPMLEPVVIYSVPRKDTSKFSSRKLSDVDYAKKILGEIR